jgi:hypothetical protein
MDAKKPRYQPRAPLVEGVLSTGTESNQVLPRRQECMAVR